MMEMVNGSRLSNAMRAAGIMRRALLESLVHARQRVAFGAAADRAAAAPRSNLLGDAARRGGGGLGDPERRGAARPARRAARPRTRTLARVVDAARQVLDHRCGRAT